MEAREYDVLIVHRVLNHQRGCGIWGLGACGEVTGVKKQAGIALTSDAKTSPIEELGQATLELGQHAATD
ncbi:hypothetical protein Ct61P_14756 [Colletotrichum tofieldiae]|nr:hypothetical protein Ct61P_14756 [Colletotrichum tofieldiae]